MTEEIEYRIPVERVARIIREMSAEEKGYEENYEHPVKPDALIAGQQFPF